MRYWNRLIRGLGILTLVAFFVTTLTPISNTIGRKMAIAPHIEPGGAIVVLAAGLMHGGELGDESMRRVLRGIELYKKGLAPLIVLSGRSRLDQPFPTEAEIRARLAGVAGIPREAILKEETANTTREESIRIGTLLKERNIRRIILVTESFHLRRAKRVFEREGLEVLSGPSDDYSNALRSPGDRLWLAMRVAMEAFALVYYRAAGYV